MSDGYLWKQVCVWKQQKGHSGRECIRWIDPGLAAVWHASLVGDSGQVLGVQARL